MTEAPSPDDAVLVSHLSRIGPYRVESVIGQGSSGMVLRARDDDGRQVAIKLSIGLHGHDRDRFMQEINACRRLDHPGIVRVFEVGEHEGQPWYSMAYHGAVSLADVLACNRADLGDDLPSIIAAVADHVAPPQPYHLRRLLPVSVALDLMVRVCQAIDHAHGRGLLHRDLKPENILLSADGQPVVCDFGLVADLERRRRLTQTGRVLGTIGYAAPEAHAAASAHMVDERSDVYALGVILRELLTGMPPHPGFSSTGSHSTALRDSGVRLMRRRVRALPRPLRIIINRAAHRQAHRRYHSVRALQADLQRFRQGAAITARPDPMLLRLWQMARDHRWYLVLVVIAMVLAGVLVIRHRTLRRLETSRWAEPVADLDLSQMAGLSATRSFAGRWRHAADGAVADDDPGRWQAFGHRQRIFGPHRVRVRMRMPAAGAVGLFAAGRSSYDDGYRLILPVGVANDAPAALYGGDQLLWLARSPLASGADHQLELELTASSVVIRIDGRVLAEVEDVPIRHGGWAGVMQRSDVSPGGVVQDLMIQGRTVPPLASAQWLAGALVGQVIHSDDPVMITALWEEAWAACDEVAASDPLAAVLLQSRAWPVLLRVPVEQRPPGWADLEGPQGGLVTALMAVDEAQRDVAWLRALIMVGLGHPAVSDDDVLAMLTRRWQHDARHRDALLLFVMHVAQMRPELAGLLKASIAEHIASGPAPGPVLDRIRAWVADGDLDPEGLE